jgi:hypothetical protein
MTGLGENYNPKPAKDEISEYAYNFNATFLKYVK